MTKGIDGAALLGRGIEPRSDGDVWVSVKEAAKYFGCHSDTIRVELKRMVSLGYDGVRKMGTRYQIRLADMDRFFRDQAKHALGCRGTAPMSDPDSTIGSEDPFAIPRTW